MNMNDIILCPYCNNPVIYDRETIEKAMDTNSKVVMECNLCEKYFLLRNDGDGQYTVGAL